MLLLKRKVTESILIGDDITVTVTKLHGDEVQLGIEAPRHIRIDREEVRKDRARRRKSGLVAGILIFLAGLLQGADYVTVTGHVSSAQSRAFTNEFLTFTPDNNGPILNPPLLISALPVRTTSTPPVGYFEIDLEQGVYEVQIGRDRRNIFQITIPAETTETNHINEYVTAGASTNFVAGDVSGWTKSAANARYVAKSNSWSISQVLSNAVFNGPGTNIFFATNGAAPGYILKTFDGSNWVAAASGGGESTTGSNLSETNASLIAVFYRLNGTDLEYRTVQAGANMVITNEGTNLVFASTASGGGNLETNASQFAPNIVLTIANGYQTTNAVIRGVTIYSGLTNFANYHMAGGAMFLGNANVQQASAVRTVLGYSAIATITNQITAQYATADSAAIFDGSKNLVSHSTVDSTEIGYLNGLTEALTTSLGNLQSATNAIDSTVSGHTTDISNLQGATNGLAARIASNETDIGNLQGATNGLDSGKQDVDAGLTALASLGAGIATSDGADGWSARGFNANQFALGSGGSTYYIKSGALLTNLSARGLALPHLTASRVAVIDANNNLTNSQTIDLTELGYLNGVTQNVNTSFLTLSNKLSVAGGGGGITVVPTVDVDGNVTWTVSDDDAGGGSVTNFITTTHNRAEIGDLYLTNFVNFYWAEAADGALTWTEGARQIMNGVVNTNITGPDMSGATTNREPMVLVFRQDGTGGRSLTHNGTTVPTRQAANAFTFITISPGPDESTNVTSDVQFQVDGTAVDGFVNFASTADIDFIDTSGTITADINGDSITASMFADSDWGDVSVSGNSVTLDNDVVGPAEMGDADHGFFTYSEGAASLDSGGITSANLSGALTDESGNGRALFGQDTDLTGTTDADTIQVTNVIRYLSAAYSKVGSGSTNIVVDADAHGYRWVDGSVNVNFSHIINQTSGEHPSLVYMLTNHTGTSGGITFNAGTNNWIFAYTQPTPTTITNGTTLRVSIEPIGTTNALVGYQYYPVPTQ